MEFFLSSSTCSRPRVAEDPDKLRALQEEAILSTEKYYDILRNYRKSFNGVQNVADSPNGHIQRELTKISQRSVITPNFTDHVGDIGVNVPHRYEAFGDMVSLAPHEVVGTSVDIPGSSTPSRQTTTDTSQNLHTTSISRPEIAMKLQELSLYARSLGVATLCGVPVHTVVHCTGLWARGERLSEEDITRFGISSGKALERAGKNATLGMDDVRACEGRGEDEDALQGTEGGTASVVAGEDPGSIERYVCQCLGLVFEETVPIARCNATTTATDTDTDTDTASATTTATTTATNTTVAGTAAATHAAAGTGDTGASAEEVNVAAGESAGGASAGVERDDRGRASVGSGLTMMEVLQSKKMAAVPSDDLREEEDEEDVEDVLSLLADDAMTTNDGKMDQDNKNPENILDNDDNVLIPGVNCMPLPFNHSVTPHTDTSSTGTGTGTGTGTSTGTGVSVLSALRTVMQAPQLNTTHATASVKKIDAWEKLPSPGKYIIPKSSEDIAFSSDDVIPTSPLAYDQEITQLLMEEARKNRRSKVMNPKKSFVEEKEEVKGEKSQENKQEGENGKVKAEAQEAVDTACVSAVEYYQTHGPLLQVPRAVVHALEGLLARGGEGGVDEVDIAEVLRGVEGQWEDRDGKDVLREGEDREADSEELPGVNEEEIGERVDEREEGEKIEEGDTGLGDEEERRGGSGSGEEPENTGLDTQATKLVSHRVDMRATGCDGCDGNDSKTKTEAEAETEGEAEADAKMAVGEVATMVSMAGMDGDAGMHENSGDIPVATVDPDSGNIPSGKENPEKPDVGNSGDLSALAALHGASAEVGVIDTTVCEPNPEVNKDDKQGGKKGNGGEKSEGKETRATSTGAGVQPRFTNSFRRYREIRGYSEEFSDSDVDIPDCVEVVSDMMVAEDLDSDDDYIHSDYSKKMVGGAVMSRAMLVSSLRYPQLVRAVGKTSSDSDGDGDGDVGGDGGGDGGGGDGEREEEDEVVGGTEESALAIIDTLGSLLGWGDDEDEGENGDGGYKGEEDEDVVVEGEADDEDGNGGGGGGSGGGGEALMDEQKQDETEDIVEVQTSYLDSEIKKLRKIEKIRDNDSWAQNTTDPEYLLRKSLGICDDELFSDEEGMYGRESSVGVSASASADTATTGTGTAAGNSNGLEIDYDAFLREEL